MSSVIKFSRAFALWLAVGLSVTAPRLDSQAPPQSSPAAEAEKVPFTIEHAEHFFHRQDSSQQERFILQGNVEVTRGDARIKCGSLTYFPLGRYFLCLDSVYLSDPQRQLRTDSLFYYVDSSYYKALGNLRWSTAEFSGKGLRGEYDRRREVIVVEGQAELTDSLHRIKADRLEYDYTTEKLQADGHVELLELKTGSQALASSALYERPIEHITLSRRPRVIFYDPEDTLSAKPYHLTCDLLKSFGSDSLIATGRVILRDDSLRISADSIFHDRPQRFSYFRGNPAVVEHPSYKLKGEEIEALTTKRRLRKVTAFHNSRGEFYFNWAKGDSSREPEPEEPPVGSWIEGDTLRLSFSEKGLDSIAATGSARSYYRQSPEASVNYLLGAKIVLILGNGTLERVEVLRGGRGLFIMPDTMAQTKTIPDSAGFEPGETPP